MIHLRALKNDFSGPARLPEAIYNVKRYSHHVTGGPKVAFIDVQGIKANLEELFKFLRTPIILDNEAGDATWWGFIAEVKVTIGAITVSRSIDGMRNKITIRYSTADGTDVGRTDAAEHADSIATYGTRELVDSMPSATLAQAISYRDTLLALRNEPQLAYLAGASDGTAVSASLTCRGWWSTTDWLYYQAPESEQAFNATVTAGSSFGWYMTDEDIAYDATHRRIYHFGTDTAAVQQSGFGENMAGEQLYVINTGSPGPNHDKSFTIQSASNQYVTANLLASYGFDTDPSYPALGRVYSTGNVFYSFQAGDMIRVSGSTSNDGIYRVSFRASDGTALYLTTATVTEAPATGRVITRPPYIKVSGVVADDDPIPGVDHILESRYSAAQSFQLDGLSSLTVGQVKVWLKNGAQYPAQDIILYLSEDDGGEPDASSPLAISEVSMASVSSLYTLVTFTLDPPVALVSGTTYWLQLLRDVPGTTERRGQVWLGLASAGGYTLGSALFQEAFGGGGLWAPLVGDAPFQITGDLQTTELAESILNGYGQFFSDVQVLDASGVISQQRRNGNQTARQEVESLLSQGTSDRKPLYVSVDVNRVARIYKEPAEPDARAMWRLHVDGTLTTAAGATIPASRCPVGCWVKLHNVFSPSFDIPGIVDPSIAFIEEAEYDVATDRWRPMSRGSDSPWAIGGLRKG